MCSVTRCMRSTYTSRLLSVLIASTAPRALGFGLVTDRLYIVAIRTNHEGAEIIRVIDLADSGWPVVLASGGHGRHVEGDDLFAIFRRECKMHGPLGLFAGFKP